MTDISRCDISKCLVVTDNQPSRLAGQREKEMKGLFFAVLGGVVAGMFGGTLFEIILPTWAGIAVLPVWALIGGLVGFLAEWKCVPAKDKHRWGALA